MISEIRNSKPLVHCITNPISINQCANAILALGARPVMAEHPDEVEEITGSANAVLLNLGNITEVRMKSIMISASKAKENNIPVVIDLVGISCSTLRRNFAVNIIQQNRPTLLKGNYSEIMALYNEDYKSSGVDSENLEIDMISDIAFYISNKYNAFVVASGKVDVVTDGKKIIHIKNGSSQLSRLTGTGCMLGALCACFLCIKNDITAPVEACTVLGICGELSETLNGNGIFMVNLIDNLSLITDSQVKELKKTEEIKIE